MLPTRRVAQVGQPLAKGELFECQLRARACDVPQPAKGLAVMPMVDAGWCQGPNFDESWAGGLRNPKTRPATSQALFAPATCRICTLSAYFCFALCRNARRCVVSTTSDRLGFARHGPLSLLPAQRPVFEIGATHVTAQFNSIVVEDNKVGARRAR